MLVICTKTGLTYARKVHKEGEVFILTGILEREYKDLSDEAWNRKQKRTYSGDVTFRRPTSDEIYGAIKDGSLDPGSASVRGHLSKRQLRIALDYAEGKEMKKITAIRMLKESVDMEIEDAPEKKAEVVKAPEKEVEVVKAPEKEVEAPKEKVELIELAEDSEETVKEPAEKAPEAPEEEPKAEESVKEPEASEEAPEKEPEAPKEEPVKKKDKGKKKE